MWTPCRSSKRWYAATSRIAASSAASSVAKRHRRMTSNTAHVKAQNTLACQHASLSALDRTALLTHQNNA